ncbi:hypothetical protein KJ951_00490 [Patescibacteria group bacterium]|nr:hypothetical protein [Patescibacteria group bacterium]MBU1702861.1 hypothetical protein [Patescibacteria group bacterium]MBU1953896.1 hypothetical protein [Patescibacteria group bacterium]
MSGEYIKSNTLEDYWKKLKAIYVSRSTDWEDLTKEQYEAIEHSERQDSDNHLNEQRLKDEADTNVVDYCFYKFMPDRKVAYHITVTQKDGKREEHYFQITLKKEIE